MMKELSIDGINDEYLSRFPTRLRKCLSDKQNREVFCNELYNMYEDVDVYRGIHQNDAIKLQDFMGNIDTSEFYGVKHNYPNVPGSHSVSVNEDVRMLIKSTRIPNARTKLIGIAKGKMKSKYGPATFRKGKPHHDWYIFESCIGSVVEEFSVQDMGE